MQSMLIGIKKYWQFLCLFILLTFTLTGFFIWNDQIILADSLIKEPENNQAEKEYYSDLVYVVNEMKQQIESIEEQSQDEIEANIH
jgi:bifunctional N-acetylglucosamine-1-phosphate-uridyltransferase/glucosamine-1-phosphate-acetyltransferase GlmU-like protein